MPKRILTYVLLTLLVLQSGMAMGDLHQQHQSGTEHLTFDDTHQHVDAVELEERHAFNVKSTDASSDQLDCHHCCHCHGHFCPVMVISSSRIVLLKNASPIPEYLENVSPLTFDNFLRPPIA